MDAEPRGAPGRRPALLALALLAAGCASVPPALPSWQDGPTRASIVAFVERVTDPASPQFVPVPERIAVFDNDGTLWCEQPVYFQLAFVFDRVRALAPEHPQWREQEPFRSVLAGDPAAALHDKENAAKLVMATHAGMSADEFAAIARDWAAVARHPSGMRYREMTYLPMRELLEYLRAHGFKTFLVSGGGSDFMRVLTQDLYGVPPEQVVGSTIAAQYELRDGSGVLIRQPKIEFVDDGAGKPVGIHRLIGRRPIFAAGNSDGDLQMLQYTTLGNPRPGFALLVHHDDAEREFRYDRESKIGKLDAALDEARARGWTVVSMRDDWRRVFEGAADAAPR